MVCCIAVCLFLFGCNDDMMQESPQSGKRFELTVGQSANTRLELGEDGLTTMWEPGDQLVLVDKSGSIAPIYLTSTLSEPANSATFVSGVGVPAGNYWVLYNYNENMAYGHQTFASIETINEEDRLALWGELNVTENTTSASVEMKHIYCKVRVELQNIPAEYQTSGKFTIGMYAPNDGFNIYSQLTSTGFVNTEREYDSYNFLTSGQKWHNIRIGNYGYNLAASTSETPSLTEMANCSALILPTDWTEGQDVYFYIVDEAKYNELLCYEIKKTNVKFIAGKSYKIQLDMSAATQHTLVNNEISTVDEWRLAAYINKAWETYELTADIDFKDKIFFPISAEAIIGNNHTISNVNLNWNNEDKVGLIKNEWKGQYMYSVEFGANMSCSVSDLTLENITVIGNNYVGALGGKNISANNCKLIGASIVTGNGDYVGGLVGNDGSFIDISIGQSCRIEGGNYVGGIVGNSSIRTLQSCISEATIEATGDYVGGVFGKIGGNKNSDYSSIALEPTENPISISKCINKGKVIGVNYVGGIGGDFAIYCSSSIIDPVLISESYSKGEVLGSSYVGGIVGRNLASINTCYSVNNISATTTAVGGIVGVQHGGAGCGRIANCYSLAILTVGEDGVSGGIVGDVNEPMNIKIQNCYFAGTNGTDCGVIGYSRGGTNITNCLTTLPSLGTNLSQNTTNPDVIDANSKANVTSILDNINVINGDNAYSTNVWSGYPYEPVKFASFTTDTESPDLEEDTI